MNKAKLVLISFSVLLIAACRTAKQSPASSYTTQSNNFVFVKPDDGIRAPGAEELTAIRTKYKETTMEVLKEGHFIYTQGACINCHNAENIYTRGEAQWKDIIEDMAQRANISETQKEAVLKYVLSIKALQSK